jgi:hypothetical protein
MKPKIIREMFRPKRGVERAKFLKNDFFLQKKIIFKKFSSLWKIFFFSIYLGRKALSSETV